MESVGCGAGLAAGKNLVGDKIAEGFSCCGVDFHPLCIAPFGELVRVYVHPNDPMSFDLKAFAACFGGGEPLIIGPMEFVTILKHSS